MPQVRVQTTITRSLSDILLVENYVAGCGALDVRYQYLVAEVVLLRLFSILEQAFSETAYKLACGATYLNGVAPNVIVPCRTMEDARVKMLTVGHARPKAYLSWTKAKFIRESIEKVLDIADPFYANVLNHGSLINEMRIVRNHVAHRTRSTRREFNRVVRSQYGANARVSSGVFLVSPRRVPSNISRYLTASRIALADIANG